MKQKKWLFVLMFVGAGLVVAALFLYLLFSRQGMILSERVLTPAPAAPVEVTLPLRLMKWLSSIQRWLRFSPILS